MTHTTVQTNTGVKRIVTLAGHADVAELSPGSVGKRLAMIRSAQPWLREQRPHRIAGWLDALQAYWRDSRAPLRQQAIEDLGMTTGWSRLMCEEAVTRAAAELHGSAWLRTLVEAEVDNTRDVVCGRPVSAHVLGGPVPATAAVALARSLILRSACFIKPASAEPTFVKHLVASLAEVEPALASVVAHGWWPAGASACLQALGDGCDVVSVSGTNSALANVQQALGAQCSVVTYGERIGMALVDQRVVHNADGRSWARGCAEDAALYDQHGCLSCQVVYVVGADRRGLWQAADVLAEEMERACRQWPVERRAVAFEAGTASWLRDARVRAAEGMAVRMWGAKQHGDWLVAAVDDPTPELIPGCRSVMVKPLPAWERLAEWLVEWSGSIQGIAIAASAEQRAQVTQAACALGVRYCCHPGQLQRPPVGWHQEGRAPFSEWLDNSKSRINS